MSRTYVYEDALPFIVDQNSIQSEPGRDIDWANVVASTIPAGTIMCELADGRVCPVAEAPGVETAIGLLASSANENDKTGLAGHGLIVGGVIYSNLLPDAGDGSFTTWTTQLNTSGVGYFVWKTYEDDRAV